MTSAVAICCSCFAWSPIGGAIRAAARLESWTKMFVSLFQIRRQHIFDPFHECADSARQIAAMCYDEGHGERPAPKIGYDLHERSTL
jgi:hypothetical protein